MNLEGTFLCYCDSLHMAETHLTVTLGGIGAPIPKGKMIYNPYLENMKGSELGRECHTHN